MIKQYLVATEATLLLIMAFYAFIKGGIEGPAGPANAVPLSKAVCVAGPLFDRGHTHLMDY